MSLPVIFTKENGERVIVNWDAIAYIAPATEYENEGSIIHFNAPPSDTALVLGIREGLEAIERRLQSATRA
jgi:hypothetical protein